MIISGDGQYDLSIIASLKCNLRCPHCQYDAGPDRRGWLDEVALDAFLSTVDRDDINSMGFYGGELSVDLARWARYIKRALAVPRWCITNGSWSTDATRYREMVDFVSRFGLMAYISTTVYHTAHQNGDVLGRLVDDRPGQFDFKEDDTLKPLLPMGRNYYDGWRCSVRCQRGDDAERLAVLPDGNIIYQKCDGVYPVIGNILDQGWSETTDAIEEAVTACAYSREGEK